MKRASPRHLVAVWNPSYTTDAMEEHLRVLLHWSELRAKGEADADEVYVMWSRLRSPNRVAPLPHLDDVFALRKQIESGTETHLYLTDFRSLYVGWLSEITSEQFLDEYPDEIDHLPAYAHGRPTDFYFTLWDIRRLVADDTVGTAEELSRLLNVRYDRRPVSLYGGMVDLPLIVERPDARLWFSDRGILTDGRLWAEHDASRRSETERVSRDLRENLFGDDLWGALEPGTRAFLASGEAVYRARRNDPNFDFSSCAIEYAKAIETELNALVFPLLRPMYSKGSPVGRMTSIEGRQVDLGKPVSHQTLGAMVNLLEHNQDVRRGLKAVFPARDAKFLMTELPHYIRPVGELRNPAAHDRRLTREEVSGLREEIMGIGREGLLVRLGRTKIRTRAVRV